jgi:glycerophosphoryl diester phosphodiesterase
MTQIFAHRGYHVAEPENTVSAFVAARTAGADGVELDVRRTCDGVLVVHHDAVIEGVGWIHELAYDDLPGTLTRLEGALRAAGPLVVNVEVKFAPEEVFSDPDLFSLGTTVAGVLAEAQWRDRVLVSSFHPGVLAAVHRAQPQIPLGWLLTPTTDPGPLLRWAREQEFASLHPHVSRVDAAVVDQALVAGLGLHVWTVNSESDLAAMFELDVTAVITDSLPMALALRATR